MRSEIKQTVCLNKAREQCSQSEPGGALQCFSDSPAGLVFFPPSSRRVWTAFVFPLLLTR